MRLNIKNVYDKLKNLPRGENIILYVIENIIWIDAWKTKDFDIDKNEKTIKIIFRANWFENSEENETREVIIVVDEDNNFIKVKK
ncbi:MAG: hypothetical protein LBF97_03705 [Elusimicrobiota bacterium]|jgi:hypothetical protein|nr:hypothetical protein [Elusimicrobiota bacterium]